MAAVRRTLLIAGSAPGDGNVGALLLRRMLECIDSSQVSVAAIGPATPPDPDIPLAACRVFDCPNDCAHRPVPGWRGTAQAVLHRQRRYEPEIRAVGKAVLEFANEQQAEQVWIIADSIATIDAVSSIRTQLPREQIVQIWDDPRHLMMLRKLDRWTSQRTAARFENLLAGATRVGVISEPMAEDYSTRTAAPCLVVQDGLDNEVIPCETPTSTTEFHIGFAGAMYAPCAWHVLLQALDRCQWRLGEKRIVLNVAGSAAEFRSQRPANARYYGWRSQRDILEILGSCDLLYLPQPFDGLNEPLTRLSFPTKLSTYVSTGRPVLIHTPEYSSLSRFSREQQFGLLCNSLDPAALASRLAPLMDDTVYRDLAHGSARIGSEILTRQRFRTSVTQLVAPDATSSIGAHEDSTLETATAEQTPITSGAPYPGEA